MDIQKYIQSGILEDYVLGLVSEKEALAIEQNIVQYPALKAELNQIEDALASYAQAKAMPMPKGLTAQIMQSIEQLETDPSPTSDTTPPKAKPQAAATKGTNTLGIVLGLALAGSLLGSFFLNQQKKEVQGQLVAAQTQVIDINDRMVTLQLDCDQKDGTIQSLQEQIAILKNPAYRPISLEGTGNAPNNTEAIVYYNPNAKNNYFDFGNLPATPTDRDYQLWAIIGGVPTDMGVLSSADLAAGFVSVIKIDKTPQAFAITLEPRDGNPAPNLDELFVIGNV